MTPNEGEIEFLEAIKTRLQACSIQAWLLKGNVTPADGDALADYTAHEANYSGYSRLTITNWGTVGTNAAGQAELVADEAVFQHNGGATANDIYCWVLVNATSSKILKSVRFSDAPRNMSSAGSDNIVITPHIRLSKKGG